MTTRQNPVVTYDRDIFVGSIAHDEIVLKPNGERIIDNLECPELSCGVFTAHLMGWQHNASGGQTFFWVCLSCGNIKD